jgi:hypothetical protein
MDPFTREDAQSWAGGQRAPWSGPAQILHQDNLKLELFLRGFGGGVEHGVERDCGSSSLDGLAREYGGNSHHLTLTGWVELDYFGI